jgi:hypothetical protein
MPEVFEDARVGVLMDVNKRLQRIDTIAQENGGVKYGSDWADIRPDDPTQNARHAQAIIAKYGDVWYDVIRANLMVAASAEDKQTLESVAIQVAALATAWAADIRQRPVNV